MWGGGGGRGEAVRGARYAAWGGVDVSVRRGKQGVFGWRLEEEGGERGGWEGKQGGLGGGGGGGGGGGAEGATENLGVAHQNQKL